MVTPLRALAAAAVLAVVLEVAAAHHGLFTASMDPPTLDAPGKHTFRLTITDEAGEGVPMGDMVVVHERLIHVIVLSEDWRYFAHLHPEETSDPTEASKGEYSLELDFAAPGKYTVMVEFAVESKTFVQETQVIDLEATVEVFGGTESSQPQEAILTCSANGKTDQATAAVEALEDPQEGEYTIELTVNHGLPLFVGTCAPLTLSYSTAGGGPVTDLSPYLGAAAHIALAHQSMAVDTLSHTHAMADMDMGMGPAKSSTSDHCAIDMLDMLSPPAAFGSRITAYHRFLRPGRHVVVAGARHRGLVVTARFVVEVLELPVSLYTNPDGPITAGQEVELEVRLAAESFWGTNPGVSLGAAVLAADFTQATQHLQLAPGQGEGPEAGLTAPVIFPAAGEYHVIVHGLLQTETQAITVQHNFTLQVEGEPGMGSVFPALDPSPVGRYRGTLVSMVGLVAGQPQASMGSEAIQAFARSDAGDMKVSLEVNNGGVAIANHCTSLRIQAQTNKVQALQLATVDGVPARVVVASRDSESGRVSSLQYTQAVLQGPTGGLVAEGYTADTQRDLVRRLCTPLTAPPKVSQKQLHRMAVAFVTFPSPGQHFISVTFQTAGGEPAEATFVVTVCPDSRDPIRWSSSCAWPVPPGIGDRILIPGGKRIILDTDTPELEELAVHGTLEVESAPGLKLNLRAGRLAVEKGGRFLAGDPSEPFQGQLEIRLNRGGLPLLGEGQLTGGGLLGVAEGRLSLVGAPVSDHTGRFYTLAEAPAGTLALELASEAPFSTGDQLVISSGPSESPGRHTSETAEVSATGSPTSVELSAGLKANYAPGSLVMRLSRPIRITSKQYADGGGCVRIAPPEPQEMPSAAAPARRLREVAGNGEEMQPDITEEELEALLGEAAGSGWGTRRLLHSDPTASLTRPGDYVVAGGGSGATYYVGTTSTSVTLQAVEFAGMGKLSNATPAFELRLPDGLCGGAKPDAKPAPEISIRDSAFHGLHSGCVRLGGVHSQALVENTLCYEARGEGIALVGAHQTCPVGATAEANISGNTVIGVQSETPMAQLLLRQKAPASCFRVKDWAGGESTAPTSLRMDNNLGSASQGNGFSIARSNLQSFEGNVAHHNQMAGLNYGPEEACPFGPGGVHLQEAVPVLKAASFTSRHNLGSEVCLTTGAMGALLTLPMESQALPDKLAPVPHIHTLTSGAWVEGQISSPAVDKLRYYRLVVPEDAVSVKLMVEQLEGYVDVLVNPFGGAPCHEKFEGCLKPAGNGQPDPTLPRSNIRTMAQGFSAQEGQQKLITLPLPAYATGPWVVGVGCKTCSYRLGLNITTCGGGWMAFPSEGAPVLSPSQLASGRTEAELVELAGMNFTCVQVVHNKVNQPAGNFTLEGNGASVFLRTEVEDYTSQLWTRVGRLGHTGQPSSLHFRTYSGRLPTFSANQKTPARTLQTALYDVQTPAPDVAETTNVQDDKFPVDHFSMMMMFINPGVYYTVVTQNVVSPDIETPAVATVDVEVGTVRCETGKHVSSEPYFFPPHHVEDMVEASNINPTKRSCSVAVKVVEGGRHVGPQGPSERYAQVAGATRGGRTSIYMMEVPEYASHLNIRVTASKPSSGAAAARAEMYLRHAVPPLIVDQEDYVQWEWDKFVRLQGLGHVGSFDVPWYELYGRWGRWYLVLDWLGYDQDGTITVEVTSGSSPFCSGDPPCSSHGTCWSLDSRSVCHCHPGWEGDDCGLRSQTATSPHPTGDSSTLEAATASTTELAQIQASLDASADEVAALRAQLDAATREKQQETEKLSEAKASLSIMEAHLEAAASANQTPAQDCSQEVASCMQACEAGQQEGEATQQLSICSTHEQQLSNELRAIYDKFGGISQLEQTGQEVTVQHELIANLTQQLAEQRDSRCPSPSELETLRDGVDRAGLNVPVTLLALASVAGCSVFLWLVWRTCRRRGLYTLLEGARGTEPPADHRDMEMAAAASNIDHKGREGSQIGSPPAQGMTAPGLRGSARKPFQD